MTGHNRIPTKAPLISGRAKTSLIKFAACVVGLFVLAVLLLIVVLA